MTLVAKMLIAKRAQFAMDATFIYRRTDCLKSVFTWGLWLRRYGWPSSVVALWSQIGRQHGLGNLAELVDTAPDPKLIASKIKKPLTALEHCSWRLNDVRAKIHGSKNLPRHATFMCQVMPVSRRPLSVIFSRLHHQTKPTRKYKTLWFHIATLMRKFKPAALLIHQKPPHLKITGPPSPN